jgi:hypothetical protein
MRDWGVRWAALYLAACACRFGFGPWSDDDEPIEDARVDAAFMQPPGDAGSCEPTACAAAGGTCTGVVCQVVSGDESILSCPPGMPCRLVCDGYRYCRDGARCNGATWCEVACLGYRACQSGVACDGSDCLVTCNGEEACESGISATSTCTAHCCGIQTCAGGVGTCTQDNVCT